ncbi:hypothetical protein ES705_15024 [subsurface metagenome]
MPKIIVSDTSCLILLDKLGRIDLLKSLFGRITITKIIADEFKGRREAKQLGINYTGTIGILIVAKEKGLINSVIEILDAIRKTDFRISNKLISESKKKSRE